MSFREAIPPEPPTRSYAPGPRWGTSVPQTPCARTSKSWLRHCNGAMPPPNLAPNKFQERLSGASIMQ